MAREGGERERKRKLEGERERWAAREISEVLVLEALHIFSPGVEWQTSS
jgi:hypothetical protein